MERVRKGDTLIYIHNYWAIHKASVELNKTRIMKFKYLGVRFGFKIKKLK